MAVKARLERVLSSRPKRVLCVEDHADTAELYRLVMRAQEVTCADTLGEARRQRAQTLFDLYVLDEELPDGTGLDLCHEIRAVDLNTPIIFASADARAHTRYAALEAGAQVFFTKPLDPMRVALKASSLLSDADRRSEHATLVEVAAMCDALLGVNTDVEVELGRTREQLARTTELLRRSTRTLAQARATVIEARAFEVFVAAGGAPSTFKELWANVLAPEMGGGAGTGPFAASRG
jgi:DNA-binding response OmpR family regulator